VLVSVDTVGMADISLKRGQAATINLAVFGANGSSPLDLTPYDGGVVLVIGGARGRLEIAAVLASPLSLGTGTFTITTSAYSTLRDNSYQFEIWLKQSTSRIPVRSGTLEIVDVPQPS
jgi:hypothetical protein